jgi:uncharacterized protein
VKFTRKISARLESAVNSFPAVVLTGARQVGKTTLLKTAFPHFNYVTLDLMQDAQMAEEAPDQFFKKYKPPLIIDEVQYAPKIFRHLKVIIDKDPSATGRFILTGSHKFTLMKEVAESLAGRCAVLELEGLASDECDLVIKEFLAKHGPEAVLTKGMMPRLWENLSVSENEFHGSYLSTYIERDVRQILNVGSLRDFDRFMRICATYNGSELNKSSIASTVGISKKTVADWLSVLVASNQIALLEPYFTNIKKRIVKSPRLYFCDTGLLCFLLGLDKGALTGYAGIGTIWEAYIFAEIRKHCAAYELQMQPWFYRDSAGLEVDFVLSSKGKIQLLEVKWTELPSSKMLRGIKELRETLPETTAQSYVVCRTSIGFPLGDEISAINGFELGQILSSSINTTSTNKITQ